MFVYILTVSSLPQILQDDMGTSESANGVVTAMFGVGSAVGSVVAGILSDRVGNRRTMQAAGSLLYTAAGLVFFFSRHYYQVLVFRLLNGIASGVACTLMFAALGDVYPASLLGLKVAVVALCNNIAYTIGPVCGQRLFDIGGVRGPATAMIALSIAKLLLFSTAAVDSLSIRESVHSQVPAAAHADSAECIVSTPHVWVASAPLTSDSGSTVARAVSAPSRHEDKERRLVETLGVDASSTDDDVSVLRLLTRLPVIASTVVIVAIIGVQCMLEGIVPLHLRDKLKYTDSNGVTFVIIGVAFTVASPVVGWAADALVERWGEHARYYLMLAGSVAAMPALVLLALAPSYGVMMIGYVLFAIFDMCAFIPAQSAYGDVINRTTSNAMARGYGLATFAWAAAAMCLPPIGTALYERSGFVAPAIGVSLAACSVSAVACLLVIVSSYRSRRRRADQLRRCTGSAVPEQPSAS
ncbi:hypothetical protein IWQ56_000889 [Coemansia nantahalensis]|nr:hypothetical protein IWQ56_000889 [Coemansia nantahalensis]